MARHHLSPSNISRLMQVGHLTGQTSYILEAAFGAEKATSKLLCNAFYVIFTREFKTVVLVRPGNYPLGCFRQGRSVGDGGAGGNAIIRPRRWACYA